MAAKIKNSTQNSSRRNKHKPRGVSGSAFDKVHWPYLPVLMIALVLLSASLQSGVLNASALNPKGKVLAYATSMGVSGLLSSTNSARASNGVASLRVNSKLNSAAQAKAEDMATRNYWSHNTPEGNPPWIFVSNQGYSYQKLGENLAAGFDTEQAVINGWLASPPHKENMLDGNFSEVGFGFANNADYTSAGGGPMTVVVAFYGKPTGTSQPAPAPTATAPQSKTPNVTPPAVQPPQPTPVELSPPTELATPAPQQETNQISQTKPKEQKPANTDSSKPPVTLALRTSKAHLAFAKVPVTSFATGMMSFIMIAAAGYFVSRHALSLRRSLVTSESFVIKHPLIDAGLIVIVGLAYILTQTAGYIQ
ncbi:hypothetical protein H0X09_02945 [Candidatus Saccharibacteria bacterium]|nr:hypothetical protein [Candidatus Saccharibacteria bacterium]